jgi:lysozyme
MTDVKPMVVDLSHWDPAYDYDAVLEAGIVACIYKATEGDGYTDPTYVEQQAQAKEAGLLWGAYHFANAEPVMAQVDNFLRYAAPDPDELICLDWEDYGSNTMSLDDVQAWILAVEDALRRPGDVVLYSGNTAKEALGDEVNEFLGKRRLWLCQYGSSPVVQKSWDSYWLWQYTDGNYGPEPHEIPGVGPCDINSFPGTVEELTSTWASGTPIPAPRPPLQPSVSIIVAASPGVLVKVRQTALIQRLDRRVRRDTKEAR